MEKAELTALIIKAQLGDQGAMEEVLRAAHTSVSYQCRKLLRDPRDAEDMTQEVLLAVYTKLGTLKTPEAFWGWLNQATANRCINAMKRSRVELQFAEDEEGHSVLDDLEEMDEQQVPDKALDNAETTRMIEEIVDGLPDAQRVCTLMYYYDEMSVKDIANALGVSENTVKSRLNYARKAIRERVLDYEKQGVKLYSLSPLPFLLFFLRRAANEGADSARAAAAAKRAMGLGAASAAGGTAAGATGTTAGAVVAGGAETTLAHGAGGLAVKIIAGVLAGVLAVGGIVTAVVVATRNVEKPEPVVSEVVPEEEAAPVEPEPDESEPEEIPDELIPADRLALLNDIAYYGDPSQCRMTVNQAQAYAELLETNPDALYAALIDIGEGNPVLVMIRGADGGLRFGNAPEAFAGMHSFNGKLEIWQYRNGQPEQFTTTHVVRWKEGAGLACYTHLGSTEDENGNVLPAEAQVHYLDYTESVYPAEGGFLSDTPLTTITAQLDPSSPAGWSGDIDGQPFSPEEYSAWIEQWAAWDTGWVSMGVSYDTSIGGPVDSGNLDTQKVSPSPDVSAVLRQCAGE